MDPQTFLKAVVKPNVADFAADNASSRLAFNAVAAVDGLVARLFVWCRSNAPTEVNGLSDDDQFRKALANRNADYSLLRDIAKAQKHAELDRGSPQLKNASQVQRQSLGYGEGGYGEGKYGGPPQVVVTTDAGERRVVESLVKNALAFLETEMSRLGC
jgi:hypothetical protein